LLLISIVCEGRFICVHTAAFYRVAEGTTFDYVSLLVLFAA